MASKDVLTEGELDALMDGFSSGELSPQAQDAPGDWHPFDFSTREHNLLAQMPALKSLHEKHAAALGKGIRRLYRVEAVVEDEEPRLARLDETLAAVAPPVALNIVRIAPLPGLSYLAVPGALLSFLVDAYFGGAGVAPGAGPARENLTPSERRLNDVLAQSFLDTLSQSWADVVALAPELRGVESSAAYLQGGARDELALTFSFRVRVGEWDAAIEWIVPYTSLEPLRHKLTRGGGLAPPRQQDNNWERRILRALHDVNLEIVGSFTPEDVSIADVLRFKPGTILPLKMPGEVTVLIENRVFSTGEHGVLNGHKSIKIKELLEDRAIH